MKYRIITVLAIEFISLIIFPFALGYNALKNPSLNITNGAQYLISGEIKIPEISSVNSLEKLFILGANILRPVFIITFFLVILYGGYLWMISAGDHEKILKARRTIVAAIIGLSLAVFAPGINLVLAQLLDVEMVNIFAN